MDEVAVQLAHDLGMLEHDLGHVRPGLEVAPPLELEQIALGADHRPRRQPLEQPGPIFRHVVLPQRWLDRLGGRCAACLSGRAPPACNPPAFRRAGGGAALAGGFGIRRGRRGQRRRAPPRSPRDRAAGRAGASRALPPSPRTWAARRAAAAADHARPGIARQAGVGGHDLGRAVVVDLALAVLRARRSCPWRRSARPAPRRASGRARSRPAAPGRSRSWRRTRPAAPARPRAGRSPRSGSAPSWCGRGCRRSWSRRSAARSARRRRPRPRAPPRPRWSRSTADRSRLRRALPPARRTPPRPSAWSSAPIGAKISPVGPIEPATSTGRPAASATARASRAAARFSSATRPSAPCSIRRAAVAAEAVGQDQIRAGLDEALVHRLHARRPARGSRAPASPRSPALARTGWCPWRRRRAGRAWWPAARAADRASARPPGSAALVGSRRRGRLSAALVRPTRAPAQAQLNDRHALGVARRPARPRSRRACACSRRTVPWPGPAGTRRCRGGDVAHPAGPFEEHRNGQGCTRSRRPVAGIAALAAAGASDAGSQSLRRVLGERGSAGRGCSCRVPDWSGRRPAAHRCGASGRPRPPGQTPSNGVHVPAGFCGPRISD